MDLPTTVQLDTTEIELLAPDPQGTEPRRFRMMAYTGAPVSRRFGQAVFDVESFSIGDKVPILLDHDPAQRAGFADVSKIEDGRLVLEGTLSKATAAGREVSALSDEGFPWQASVGMQVGSWQDVPEGEKLTVNGREVTGPISVGRGARLLESSFLMAGADSETHAIALARLRSMKKSGLTPKDVEKKDKMETLPEVALEALTLATQPDEGSLAEELAPEAAPEVDQRDQFLSEIHDYAKAFPEHLRSWAIGQFMARRPIVEALAEALSNATAEAPAAADPESAATLATLRASAGNPGVGFDAQASDQPGDQSYLSEEEKWASDWRKNQTLRDEFAGNFNAYTALMRREGT